MPDTLLRVGIDASNIRHGGGRTHLIQILEAATPVEAGIGEVVVWACADVLARLPDRPWLRKAHVAVFEASLPRRLVWQQFELASALRRENCDVLFAPGGMLPRKASVPTVTMSRNMLPFEPTEAARFGAFSRLWFKMQLLRYGQMRSMRRADGLIFLTDYARKRVLTALGDARQVRLIPHGLADRFFSPPRPAVAEVALNETRPFRLLYVSVIDMFKHQWQVVRAVAELRQTGVPIELELVGPSLPTAMAKLDEALIEFDPGRRWVSLRGHLPFDELHRCYQKADAFVFASSCENLPNVLLEAMAAGLPIACSRMGPMPEVLGDGGVYFDPLDSHSIAEAIRRLIKGPADRERLAAEAYRRARTYSWTRCAADTFDFVAEIAFRGARSAS